MENEIKYVIEHGRELIVNKRQKEIVPKLIEIINNYNKIMSNNPKIFEDYPNSYSKNDIPDEIKYFSEELDKLDLTEFDLDLVVDSENNLTLADYILNNKIYFNPSNYSIGGSSTEIGIKFLERIINNNGDIEYQKYIRQICFGGNPRLYLIEINGQKVIDYIINNHNKLNIKIKINDYSTKKYLINNLINEKYFNKEQFTYVLKIINFTVKDLIEEININDNTTSFLEILITNNLFDEFDKLLNTIIPNNIAFSLINIYINSNNESTKQAIIKCFEKTYIKNDIREEIQNILMNHNIQNDIKFNVKENSIYGKKESFEEKIGELKTVLKEGTETSNEIINYLINNYINIYNNNSSLALKELEVLILIKKANPEFHISDGTKGPNFDDNTVNLILKDKNCENNHANDNYATLNHELTHAFQYYCFNDDTPLDFYTHIPEKQKISNYVASYCDKFIKFILSNENIKNEKDLINKTLNEYSYERETLDIFDTILCFTDYYKQLGFKHADIIEGHPYDYFKYGGYDFGEVLADYKSIMFSNREHVKTIIKSILGIDFTTYIENFYTEMLDNFISIYKKKCEITQINKNNKNRA